ncbi:MAG: DUF4194 domain-containing protein [Firmicutes bacterium]|jgi:hypothetical protein|nr:DUF4194 domain-containing protein [Bacillota bacterium]
MVRFEELYEQLSDKEKAFFSEMVNRLLARTFLVYEREEDRRGYRFVERHLSLFRWYLELAHWDLFHDRQLAVIQLYNRDERNRRNFSIQETIFLFILRLIYDDKRQELRLTDQVLVSGQEIQEKYLALGIRQRLPAREDMQRILRLFGRFSLLELRKGQWRDPEALYLLYPSLLMVLNTADLESLAEWLGEQAAWPEEDPEDEDELEIDD